MSSAAAASPICFAYPQPSALATYRCYHHYRSARALGFEADIVGDITAALLEEHELFAFASPITPEVTILAEWLRHHGKRVWFDVPEELFSAAYDEAHDPDRRQGLEYERNYARYADVLTTSNEFLASQARSLNEQVFVVPNYIDERIWEIPLPSTRASLGLSDDVVTIGWAGSEESFAGLHDLEAVIGSVMRENPEIMFITVGDDPELAGLPRERCRHLSVRGMDEYVDFLRHIDVAVVGARHDFTSKCRSDVRLLEHGMAGSAVVASDVRPYAALATTVPGIALASSETEWSESLSSLVADESARREAAAALKEHVVGSRLLSANAEACRAPIEALQALALGGEPQ